MRIPLAVVFLAVAAIPATAQVEEEYLKRRLEEKRKEIETAREELNGLRKELIELDENFALPPEFRQRRGPAPHIAAAFVSSAATLWTDWDDSLGLGNGNGFSVGLFPCMRTAMKAKEEDPDKGFFSTTILPLGVRFWRAEDELTGGDVEVISYRLIGFWAEVVQPEHLWGFNLSAVWGLTRYSSDGPGGDSDMGHGFSFEGQLVFPVVGPVRAGAGISADLVNTRFNQEHTELTSTYSALLSLEVGF